MMHTLQNSEKMGKDAVVVYSGEHYGVLDLDYCFFNHGRHARSSAKENTRDYEKSNGGATSKREIGPPSQHPPNWPLSQGHLQTN